MSIFVPTIIYNDNHMFAMSGRRPTTIYSEIGIYAVCQPSGGLTTADQKRSSFFYETPYHALIGPIFGTTPNTG